MEDLYSLSLRDITPPNIAADPKVSSLITALDPQLQNISTASLEPLIFARIDELPEKVIDLLAWQLHADFYDLAGTLSMKRAAVKKSLHWHMHKGTVWAIKEALNQIDISAEFVHWHDAGGRPYTFKLDAIVTGDFYRTEGRGKLQSTIRRAVEESKAARSLMSSLDIQISFKEELGLCTAVIPFFSGGRTIRLSPPTDIQPPKLWTGIAAGLQGSQTIKLPHEEDIHSSVYAAQIRLINHDINLGVNLDIMQELLLQFEQRILARIDAYELRTIQEIDFRQKQTNAQFEELKDMLRWQGDDEEL